MVACAQRSDPALRVVTSELFFSGAPGAPGPAIRRPAGWRSVAHEISGAHDDAAREPIDVSERVADRVHIGVDVGDDRQSRGHL